MKYETCGMPIKGFVGLKSKMYTFITDDEIKYKIPKYKIFEFFFQNI